MKKIISFCVYGPHSLYNDGAYENIAEAKEYFPDWICRFYVANDCPILSKLLKSQYNKECEVVIKDPENGIKGMFWRLEAISDPEASYIIIRDTDQRVSDKDAQTVQKWIENDAIAHRMHEEGGQAGLALMGCAWGIKGGVIKDINKRIEDWINQNTGYTIGAKYTGDTHSRKNILGHEKPKLYYGADQIFLEEVVWPEISNNCKTFGILGESFPNHKPLKWGGDAMFRRIKPFTECKEIFGERPQYAYDLEIK